MATPAGTLIQFCDVDKERWNPTSGRVASTFGGRNAPGGRVPPSPTELLRRSFRLTDRVEAATLAAKLLKLCLKRFTIW